MNDAQHNEANGMMLQYQSNRYAPRPRDIYVASLYRDPVAPLSSLPHADADADADSDDDSVALAVDSCACGSFDPLHVADARYGLISVRGAQHFSQFHPLRAELDPLSCDERKRSALNYPPLLQHEVDELSGTGGEGLPSLSQYNVRHGRALNCSYESWLEEKQRRWNEEEAVRKKAALIRLANELEKRTKNKEKKEEWDKKKAALRQAEQQRKKAEEEEKVVEAGVDSAASPAIRAANFSSWRLQADHSLRLRSRARSALSRAEDSTAQREKKEQQQRSQQAFKQWKEKFDRQAQEIRENKQKNEQQKTEELKKNEQERKKKGEEMYEKWKAEKEEGIKKKMEIEKEEQKKRVEEKKKREQLVKEKEPERAAVSPTHFIADDE